MDCDRKSGRNSKRDLRSSRSASTPEGIGYTAFGRVVEGLENVESDLVQAAPQIAVAVDPNKAITAGITTAQVAGEIRTVLVGQQLGTISLDNGEQVGAFLSVDSSSVNSVEALKQLESEGTYLEILTKWKTEGGAINDFAVNPTVS